MLYEPKYLYRLSFAETLESLGCVYFSCGDQSQLYDYSLTASLHIRKVRVLPEKNGLKAKIVTFGEFGEKVKNDGGYTVFFPVNCLQIANLLNDLHDDEEISTRHAVGIHFTAPTGKVLVVDDNRMNLQGS